MSACILSPRLLHAQRRTGATSSPKKLKAFGISAAARRLSTTGPPSDRSRKVAEGRVAGVHFLMKKNKITEIHGYGRFTDATHAGGRTPTTTAVPRRRSRSTTFIIATGSSTRLVPGHVAVGKRGHLRGTGSCRAELPESIIIAGAGAIGMEFGYVLKNYGVDVTIVEFLAARAAQRGHAEVSKEIEKQFKKLGVKILTGTKVESISDGGSAWSR